jgi:hypothetical protein
LRQIPSAKLPAGKKLDRLQNSVCKYSSIKEVIFSKQRNGYTIATIPAQMAAFVAFIIAIGRL